jgi:hypothetical protein
MRKLFGGGALVLALFMFCSSGLAQVVSVDLSKLNSNARNEVIDANKKAEETSKDVVNLENINRFKEYGSVIASTLKEVCQTLNVEVNAFVKTPVGYLVTGLIVYKVIGKDVIRALWKGCVGLFLYICVIYSFVFFHAPKKFITKNDKGILISTEYKTRYKWASGEARIASVVAHVGLLIITTIIILT